MAHVIIIFGSLVFLNQQVGIQLGDSLYSEEEVTPIVEITNVPKSKGKESIFTY